MSDDPNRPARPIAEPRRSKGRAVSAVWLVPIVAVLIALAIAYQSWSNRGVLIAIAFPDASGVEVGQTGLRYREVTVGVVEDVGFSADLSNVNVYVRVNRDIAPFLDESASFWIVQPEVTARGVEGLNTILSGTYIQGTWDNVPGEARTAFVGDERAPIVPPGEQGTAIVLRAKDSSRLGPGAPILYRGIEVGEVAAPRLSPDGSEVRVDAFVRAPYDRQLSTSTRFWDASGISATLGTGGVELRLGSVASIIEGGVNFDTLITGGRPIEPGHIFNIFADEEAARASIYESPDTRSVAISALFPSDVSGLEEGAPVRFQGLRVGVVTRINGFIRPDDPSDQVQILAVMQIQPGRMGLEGAFNDIQAIDYLDELVAEGLRAQLVSTSILGGDLVVELVTPEDPGPARLEVGVADNPLIPTVEAEAGSLTATAEGVLERFNELPIEDLLASATDLLDNLNRIAGSDETRAIPGEVVALLEDGRGLVGDGRDLLTSPQIASVLGDAEAVAADLREVIGRIAAAGIADQVSTTLTAASDAARNIAEGTAELDRLAASVQTVVDDVGAIAASDDTQALPGLARETLQGGRDLLTAPELDAALDNIAAASADISALTAELAAREAAARLSDAIDAATAAAANLAEGTAELDALAASAQTLLDDAGRVVASEDTQALPGLARETLESGRDLLAAPELDTILSDLAVVSADIRTITAQLAAQEAGRRLTEALDAAAAAATSVAEGTANLPELSASAERVLAEAEELGASLNELSAKANALALDELVNSTTQLMQTADAFLSSDEADDVPVVLVETLEELRRTIETIRTGGTLDNLNTTLRSAAGAADSVRVAAQDLPALVDRLTRLTSDASGVLATYGSDSRINTELFAALRAATRAAEDVSSLARTIERNPNSLLLGR